MQTALAKQAVVEIEGRGLVSRTLLGACLELVNVMNREVPDHIKRLIFTTREDMKVVGEYTPDEGKIEINLREIIDQQLAEMVNGKKRSIGWQADYMIEVLLAMGHEIGHALHRHILGGVEYNQLLKEERERIADESAEETLKYLMENFDVEPEKVANETYFGGRVLGVFLKYQGMEWARRERHMLEQGLVYSLDGNTLTSFRTLIHKRFANGQEWRQATYPVRIEFHPNEKGEVVMAEPQMGEAGSVLIMDGVAGDEGAVIFASDEPMPLGVDDGAYAEEDGGAQDNWTETGPVNTPPAVVPQTMNPAEVPVITGGMKLPAHIAGMMQAGAAGAAVVGAGGKREYAPKQFPPNNYPAENIIQFLAEVYNRLYHHIFTECGWTGTVAAGAQDWHFENAAAVVAKPVNITDLIHKYGMPDVIMEYNTHDAQGRKLYGPWAEKCGNGLIRGEIFKQTQLPGYTLYCNFYGVGYVRVVSPQDVNKTSKSALKAREGHCIAWAIAQEKPEGKKLVGAGEDGKWTIIRN